MSSGTTEHLNAVFGFAADDVFAVGDGGTVLHYDGDEWMPMSFPEAVNLLDVHGTAPDDLYAVSAGTVYHYDGTAWAPMPQQPRDVNGLVPLTVWALAPDFVIAGGSGNIPEKILHYTGTEWEAVPEPLFGGYRGRINDISAARGQAVAVDDQNFIYHYFDCTGSPNWHAVADVSHELLGVWAVSAGEVYAVGPQFIGGAVYRYDGTPPDPNDPQCQTEWTQVTQVGAVAGLESVWADGTGRVIAVGNERITGVNIRQGALVWFYDGAEGRRMSTERDGQASTGLRGVWGLPGEDLVAYAVGQSGTILRIGGASALTVNTTADTDDGTCDEADCTLREAIHAANARPGRDEITFEIPTSDPGYDATSATWTIQPGSALPVIVEPVDIEGPERPEGSGTGVLPGAPQIVLDGVNAGDDASGLVFSGPVTTGGGTKQAQDGEGGSVRRVVAGRFFNGYQIETDNIQVQQCLLGINPKGEPLENRNAGIQVRASEVTIGGLTDAPGMAPGNIIAGNIIGASLVEGAASAVVAGNLIGGFELARQGGGTVQLPRNDVGVRILDASNNHIGGSTEQARNVISGNGLDGIRIQVQNGESTGNRIEGNYIGTTPTGTDSLSNRRGVWIENASGNVIGGTTDTPGASPGNVISGNKNAGIRMEGVAARENRVQGNLVGTNAAGTEAIPNGTISDFKLELPVARGVEIKNAPGNMIGGPAQRQGNVISGNGRGGILIEGESARENRVQSNLIGTDVTGTRPIPNNMGEDGSFLWPSVSIENASANIIGGATETSGTAPGNVLSGDHGISVGGVQAIGNRILGNAIGTNASGEADLTNFPRPVGLPVGFGVRVVDASRTRIEGNLIRFNRRNGVLLVSSNRPADQKGSGIFGNRIETNGVPIASFGIGIELVDPFRETIIGNVITDHQTGIIGAGDKTFQRARQLRIEGNRIEDNRANTGIHLDGIGAVIAGNQITGDAGDAITLENGADATVAGNNIFDNAGFGLRNTDAAVTASAQGNWWGDASGPSGEGPGTGDEVSPGVDFANWLTAPVAVVVAPGADTVFVATTGADTARVFFRNWQTPTDVLDVSLSDPEGWHRGAASATVPLDEDTGGRLDVPLQVSGGSATSRVRVTATSQAAPSVVAADSFVVASYEPQLSFIVVAPDTASLGPEEMQQFTAHGFDQVGTPFGVTPTWSATGGTIDETGLYTAGDEPGVYAVTATDASGRITSEAVVEILSATATDDAPHVPAAFALHPSYPNPFNPTATIPFEVKTQSRVVLEVYDVLGRRVAVLADRTYAPGRYEVAFDARGLPSGIYVYRIRMGSFTDAETMLLVK